MILTIDGPAGTGKSSVSHGVARRLGFDFLDTGAMYRAVALAAIRKPDPLNDAAALAALVRQIHIDFDWTAHPPILLLDGQPVDRAIRENGIGEAASVVAVVPAVRERLVALQRQIGAERANLVTEGRDQGTVVFPDAALKIYLDATPAERAHRRANQMRARGEAADETVILAQILERDARDHARRVGPLKMAPDALLLDSTDLTEAQSIDWIVARVNQTAGAAARR